jgi:membrane protein
MREPPRALADKAGKGRIATVWRDKYQGSVVQDFVHQLGTIDFGDRIILFGAALLLSVLPLVILLSALASQRVDDDIAQHLGANRQGSKVIESLFRRTAVSFNLSILIGLLLALAGTLAVARSVQVIYERTFDHPPSRGWRNVLRCFVWVAGVAGILIADAAVARTLRNGPGGLVVFGLANLVYLVLFFWWSLNFLLAGREPWRRLWPAALTTALMWIGLGVFASFYFSSTIVSDSATYGTIGVVFTLVTWFIAIGAVLTLGAVIGELWEKRREMHRHAD